MKFKHKAKISFISVVLNLVILTGFFYLILNEKKLAFLSTPTLVQASYSNLSLLQEEVPDGALINPSNVYVDDNLPGVIYYFVQPGDTLSKIAASFGVTVSHIKKINKLKSDTIKPGQKLLITEQNGIVYISKGENIFDLAQKFGVNPQDILDANGILDRNYTFEKGDEVFIPMSESQYKAWLAKNKKKSTQVYYVSNTEYHYTGKHIVKKYRYSPNVTNGFYRGQCTRFVAIKKFPYITAHKQKKLWNGNARYWYYNAKQAGYKVGKTPKVGAIVVIKYGGRRYYYAGHVAIVRQIDWKNRKLLIEEMNALGKYIVTWRWIPMDNKIIGYIYYRLNKM